MATLLRRTAAVLVLTLGAATLLAPHASAAPTPRPTTYCGVPIEAAEGDGFIASQSGNPVNDRGLVAGSYKNRDTIVASIFNPRTRTFSMLLDGPSWATDINRRGDVIGNQATPEGELTAFFRPAAGGPTVFAENPTDRENVHIVPSALNDRGLVVGSVSGGGRQSEAFIWDPRHESKPRLLGTLGGDYSDASGINRAGYIVGSSNTTPGGPVHPFIWLPRSGLMTDLGLLSGASGAWAFDINDGSYVVGYAFMQAHTQAFLWDPTTHRTQALVGPAGRSSVAYAINRRGAVAGQLTTELENDTEAVVWSSRHSTAQVLASPTRQPLASGINRRGLVVSTSYYGAVFWRPSRHCT